MSFLLNDKCESALAALVTPVAGTAAVVTGKSAGDKPEAPVVICSAEAEGMEDPVGSGNFWVSATVAIKTLAVPNADGLETTTAAGMKTANQALVEAVFTAVQVEGLAGLLTGAVAGLTVFEGSVEFGAPESGQDENGLFVDALRVRFYACGSDLA